MLQGSEELLKKTLEGGGVISGSGNVDDGDASVFRKAFFNAQHEIGPVIKENKNPYFKSSYADFKSVWDTVRPVLKDNGLFITQEPGYDNGILFLKTTVRHIHVAYCMSSTLGIPVDNNSAQGVGSAITYARRYALCSILGVVTEDDDGEKHKAEIRIAKCKDHFIKKGVNLTFVEQEFGKKFSIMNNNDIDELKLKTKDIISKWEAQK